MHFLPICYCVKLHIIACVTFYCNCILQYSWWSHFLTSEECNWLRSFTLDVQSKSMGTCKMWPKSIPSFYHMLVICSFRSRQLSCLFFPTRVTKWAIQPFVLSHIGDLSLFLSDKGVQILGFFITQAIHLFLFQTQATQSLVFLHTGDFILCSISWSTSLSSLPNTDHYLDSHSYIWVKNRLTFVQPPYQNRKSICTHHLQHHWSRSSVKYQIQHLNATHADKYISLHQQKELELCNAGICRLLSIYGSIWSCTT